MSKIIIYSRNFKTQTGDSINTQPMSGSNFEAFMMVTFQVELFWVVAL
jgi:hypothetical protein